MKRILFICIAVLCAVNIRAQVKINVDSFNEAIEQFNQTKDNNKKTFKSIEDCYWTYINRTAPFVSVNKQEDAIYTDAYISTCSRCFSEVSEFITLLMLAYDDTTDEEE